jgi:hypothetical protein
MAAKMDSLLEVIEKYAIEDHGEVKMYDFSDGITVMPVPDFSRVAAVPYRPSQQVCVLYVGNAGHKDWPRTFSDGEVHEVPGGKIIGIKFSNDISPEELLKLLTAAQEKLAVKNG